MKAQAAVEFIILLGVILSIVVAVLVVGFRANELNFALATARQATIEYATANNLIAGGVDYTVVDTTVTLYPRVYDGVGACQNPLSLSNGVTDFKTFFRTKVRDAVSSVLSLDPVKGANYNYVLVNGCP